MISILLTLSAAFCFGIAAVLQKKGIEKISKSPIAEKGFSSRALKNFLKGILTKSFLLGTVTSISGGLLWLTAISLGRLSTMVPLLNFSIIVTWLVGAVYLKEKLKYREWLALLLIFIGGVILSVGI